MISGIWYKRGSTMKDTIYSLGMLTIFLFLFVAVYLIGTIGIILLGVVSALCIPFIVVYDKIKNKIKGVRINE